MTPVITRERKKQLNELYAQRVANATPAETQEEWFKYLVYLWNEDGNLQIFMDIRVKSRSNGARASNAFLAGERTAKQLFNDIQKYCSDRYAADLHRIGLANIDQTTRKFQQLSRDMAFEVMQAIGSIKDPTDKTEVCIAQAKNWWRWVELLHAAYRLPTVAELEKVTTPESDAEDTVLRIGIFETAVTPRQRRRWEDMVA